MPDTDILFTPGRLGPLKLKNRFVGSAHEPAYGVGGLPLERYQAYLEERAKGGAALVMFGGSAMVSSAWSPSFGQLNLADDRIIDAFGSLAERIHKHGAYTITQISHPGRRSRFDLRNWVPPVAPGPFREPEHRSAPKVIEPYEMRMILNDYAAAAVRCEQGGLDGVEVAFQAGQLLNAFLSPDTNALAGSYGGSLENRLRFGLEVLELVRERTGSDFAVGIRMVGDELSRGGMDQQQCLEAAEAVAQTGLVDYINVVGGRAGDLVSGSIAIPNMAFRSAPYLYLPSAIRAAVKVPVMMAQKISDPHTAARAVSDGHIDFVAMNRPFLADPHFVNKLRDGRSGDIRLCVGANYCIDRIYVGGDAVCIQNPAAGRELRLPHIIRKSGVSKRVVVVGGGPGGMEASRVAACRGHQVTLFEAEDRLGGQLNLAASLGWRRPLMNIAGWLEGQLASRGVEVRRNYRAGSEDVLALEPDCVVAATGGLPIVHGIDGSEHAATGWQIVSGQREATGDVIVFDDFGGHQGLTAAEVAAAQGARVEYVTPYRSAGVDLGGTNIAIHLANLNRAGAMITTSQRLVRIYPEDGKMIAVLRHEYSLEDEERVADLVVAECGTLPSAEIFEHLKPASSNAGEIDYSALISGKPQQRQVNPSGRFQLYRIGDAVCQRNIHAALYDALRILKDV